MSTIVIRVNGERKEIDPDSTVAGIIEEMSLDRKQLAVELNCSILPRSRYEIQQLANGDILEIVQAVGGG